MFIEQKLLDYEMVSCKIDLLASSAELIELYDRVNSDLQSEFESIKILFLMDIIACEKFFPDAAFEIFNYLSENEIMELFLYTVSIGRLSTLKVFSNFFKARPTVLLHTLCHNERRVEEIEINLANHSNDEEMLSGIASVTKPFMHDGTNPDIRSQQIKYIQDLFSPHNPNRYRYKAIIETDYLGTYLCVRVVKVEPSIVLIKIYGDYNELTGLLDGINY